MSSEALVPSPTSLLVTPKNVEEARTRLQNFRAYVSSVLIDGVDFGVIPGTEKATLYKAGAERICQLFNLTPTVEFLTETEDWDREPPFFYYKIKSILTVRGSGEVVGEGLGSANSREKKYRDRKEFFDGAWGEVPSESGWRRGVKKYPGQKNRDGSPKQDYVYYYRIRENLDTADVANTVLKIAKKRAFIDATLTVSAASEFFTQDLEDFSEEKPGKKQKAAPKENKSRGSQPAAARPGVNESAEACPDCRAPSGKKHATKCQVQAQDATENENQDERAEEHDKCQACHRDDGTHDDGCPNMVIDADFSAPKGDEV